MSDQFDMQLKLAGHTGLDEGGFAQVQLLFSIVERFTKAAADGAAGTTTANTKVFANPFAFPLRIVRATYNPTGGGLTANDTNFATLNILTDDGAGGAPAAAKVMNTTLTGTAASGNWTQNVNVVWPASGDVAAQLTVPVGGVIWFSIGKTAGGVAVPAGEVALVLAKM